MITSVYKNLISVLLSVIILFSAIIFPANAVTPTTSATGKIYSYIPDVEKYYPGIEEYIADCVRKYQTKIDIHKFGVAKDDAVYVFKSAMFSNPDIFYVNASYIDYQYDNVSKAVYYIYPTYFYSKNKIPTYIKKFNSAASSILEGINLNWSDYCKALLIHDRLASNCKYKKENDKSYTAYSALVTGKSVCEGYTRAYSYLLSMAGVENKSVNSTYQAHCWNLVKIDKKWYHVDVTKNDPTPDVAGYVRHKYFLSSDADFNSDTSKDKHLGWKKDITYDSSYKCSNKKYDHSYIKKISSQFAYYNGSYYFINNNYKNNHWSALIKRTKDKNKALKIIKSVWRSQSNAIYKDSFSKLSYKNGYLYFNSTRNIYRLKLSTGKIKSVFNMPDFWNKDFYGIKTKGNYIYGSRKNSYSGAETLNKILKISSSNKVLVLPFIKKSSVTIKIKRTYTMKVYRGSGKVSYKSSNPQIAKVTSLGKIKGLKKGKCKITAVKNNKKMTCTVTVKK